MNATSPAEPKAKQLYRHLGLGSVISISVGAMMGSGIFVLPLLAAEVAGPWVGLSYIFAALIVLPAMLSKAELATAMPVSGGTYIYLDRSMGPWMGTIGGLGTWLALSAKTAFALVGLGAYLMLFSSFPPLLFSLIVLLGLVAINIFGAGKASTLQVIIVVISVISLVVFSVLGVFTAIPANFHPAFPQGMGGVLAGAGLVFVSFNGVTKVCSVAEEIIEPQRNIPLGMAISLGGVTALYAVISTVITANVDLAHSHHDVTPIATAAGQVLGPSGVIFMSAIAIAGLISMCNAGILSTARFPFAMSRDGLMPAKLAEIHPSTGTPAYAIAFTALLLLLLVTLLPVYSLAKLASGFTVFIFCVENLAVIVLREAAPAWYRPSFTSPLYPWTQILGMLGCGGILYGLGGFPTLGIVAAGLLGTAWYFAYGRSRTTRTSALVHLYEPSMLAETELTERASHGPDQIPRVVVPIFGDEPAPGHLVRLAGAFADTGLLEVLRLEEVPEGMDLGYMVSEDDAKQRLERQAQILAEDLHLEVEFNDIVTHNAKQALHTHALDHRAEWIVMEWPTRRGLHYLVRHPMAWWLEHPPCDLAILYDRSPETAPTQASENTLVEVRQGFTRLLVLAEPGPYDTMLIHIADAIAQQNLASITLLRIVPTSTDDAHVESERGYHQQIMKLAPSHFQSMVVRDDDHEGAVVRIAADFDLLILGAEADRGWRALLFGSEVHHLAERVSCSVLRLKAPHDQVHQRLPARADVPREDFALIPYLEAGALRCRLAVTNQRELFTKLASILDIDGDGVSESGMFTALWDREQHQLTALAGGSALTAPVVRGLKTTQLGVFTLAKPIAYGRNAVVDVVFAVLAPPQQRNDQLWLSERLMEMIRKTDLVESLRAASTVEEIRAALEAAETAVESV